MKKIILLLLPLVLSGCVPVQIREACRAYAWEEYGGVVRHLREYLRDTPRESDWKDSIGDEKRAMVYFYLGLAERACNIRRLAKCPRDYEESAQFRFRYLAEWKSTCEIPSTEILGCYRKAMELAPNLMCVYLHQGLELLLNGDFNDGRKRLDTFMEMVKASSESEWRRQFGKRFVSSEVVAFVDELRRLIKTSSDGVKTEVVKNAIISWYRRELYKGSSSQEMHNMYEILMKKYPVREFRFVLDIIDVRSEYDYLERTAECMGRYFIVRNFTEEKQALLEERLRKEGFSEWCYVQDSSSIEVNDDRTVFMGNKDIPVKICHRKLESGHTLVLMLSETKGVCYCFVMGYNLKMKGLDRLP